MACGTVPSGSALIKLNLLCTVVMLCRHNNIYDDVDDDDNKVSRSDEIKYYKTITNTSNGTSIIHCVAMGLENSLQIL